MSPKLGLGTAQFGLDYGITNKGGKLLDNQVKEILCKAEECDISYIDTAQAYGASEQILGKNLPSKHSFKLMTKLQSQRNLNLYSKEIWEDLFRKSLLNLNLKKIDSLLIHSSSDICTDKGFILVEWMESLRERGLIDRMGVSIYEADELSRIPIERFQLVQLPLSIYDQRMLRNGAIERLTDAGIAIHSRSAFLQGLILVPHSQWPSNLSMEFREHHAKISEKIHGSNGRMLDEALSFLFHIPNIEAVIVGTTSLAELTDIVTSWERVSTLANKFNYKLWSWENSNDLDPREWLIK